MFQKKLKEFNEAKASHEDIIASLQEKRIQLEAKLAQAEEAYDQVLILDVQGGTKRTQNELNKLLQITNEYKHQLTDNERRIEVTREAMTKRLQDLMPGLKAARDIAINEAKDEINESKIKAMELKAKYILFARELNKPFKLAKDVSSQFINAAHEINNHEFDRCFLNLPTLNLIGTYEGPHASLIPTVKEVSEAYNFGKLPFFVQLYELTGEILPEGKAIKKIEQLRKESDSNE